MVRASYAAQMANLEDAMVRCPEYRRAQVLQEVTNRFLAALALASDTSVKSIERAFSDDSEIDRLVLICSKAVTASKVPANGILR